ncbi:hypothetical protein NLX69_24140 [Rossellomorea sp. BNER]|nr:hypothetical protein [Rossellomorea sp. BNER]
MGRIQTLSHMMIDVGLVEKGKLQNYVILSTALYGTAKIFKLAKILAIFLYVKSVP